MFRDEPLLRLAKWLERKSKSTTRKLLAVMAPAGKDLCFDDMEDVQKVLLVRPNYRIGNTLISTPLVRAMRERFPAAKLDFLAADTTACLLEGLPVRRVVTVSRSCAWNPVALFSLVKRLRDERYDLAVEAGGGSFSGVMLAYLSGARYRAGFSHWAKGFLNVRIEYQRRSHVYENVVSFAEAMGARCSPIPTYQISEGERREASCFLGSVGLMADGVARPFVGAFVGGHLNKQWQWSRWLELLVRLDEFKIPVLVFLGPEEQNYGGYIEVLQLRNVTVVRPRPLRLFAAICARASLMVAPDSGPMHLSVAVGVPTICILQTKKSLRYRPTGPQHRTLSRPGAADVVAALKGHPAWPQPARASSAQEVRVSFSQPERKCS